jgi:glycerate dehydrogenase
VISLHCALTADNAQFVNRAPLARAKPTALLLNTERGGPIDEAALADALAGRLAGAGLDVLSSEPPRPDNPLIGAPNCVITPHIAWASLSARRQLMAATVRNVARSWPATRSTWSTRRPACGARRGACAGPQGGLVATTRRAACARPPTAAPTMLR